MSFGLPAPQSWGETKRSPPRIGGPGGRTPCATLRHPGERLACRSRPMSIWASCGRSKAGSQAVSRFLGRFGRSASCQSPGVATSRRGRSRAWHLLWITPLIVALGLGVPLVRSSGGLGDPPSILDFRFEPAIADPGADVTVRWSVEGAQSVRIDPVVGPLVEAEGSASLTAPAQTTTYVLTAENRGQTRTTSIVLQIAPQPPPQPIQDAG